MCIRDRLKDLKVRQAIMAAINREQIVKTQLPEAAKAASQFIPETVAGYNKDLKVPEYNPCLLYTSRCV